VAKECTEGKGNYGGMGTGIWASSLGRVDGAGKKGQGSSKRSPRKGEGGVREGGLLERRGAGFLLRAAKRNAWGRGDDIRYFSGKASRKREGGGVGGRRSGGNGRRRE